MGWLQTRASTKEKLILIISFDSFKGGNVFKEHCMQVDVINTLHFIGVWL